MPPRGGSSLATRRAAGGNGHAAKMIGRALTVNSPATTLLPMQPDQSMRGSNWTQQEVEATVAAYFEMLRAELLGQPYSKTEFRQRLGQAVRRSKGSIEFKHQNVSAVLVGMGLPYVDGYKPLGNYQALLADQVEVFLDKNPGFFDQLATGAILDPGQLPSIKEPALRLFVPPPERIEAPPLGQPWLSRRGRRTDFVQRDAENRRLGRLGEEFVLALEKRRLAEAGRDDLAAKVEWVSQTRGDGMGFDISSFDHSDNSERLVEVKTTGLGAFFPFYVTATEVRCSEACSPQYRLYRVFDFAKEARVYVLPGALSNVCKLTPTQYLAVI